MNILRLRVVAGTALGVALAACSTSNGSGSEPPKVGESGGSGPVAGSGPVGGSGPVAGDMLLTSTELAALAELSPHELPASPPDAANAFADDPAAAAFGQRLFFDPGFSGALLDGDNDGSINALGNKGETGKVSCAGCHVPASGFSDTRTIRQQVSLGSGWGLRRAPSLLDAGQTKLLMWDGRRDDFYSQPFGVIENPVEMNSGRLFAAYHVAQAHADEYTAIFGPLPPFDDATRFPPLAAADAGCRDLDDNNACTGTLRGAPGDGAEYDGLSPDDQRAVTRVVVNVGKALGAYERLLGCGPGRFDQFMQGDATALSASEQRGAALFVGKAKCATCHGGPFLSDEAFHNVGLMPTQVATVFTDLNDSGAGKGFGEVIADPLNVKSDFSDGDDGRDPASVPAQAQGAFRTPRLRCVSNRPSFMHTAQLKKLADVVAFFDRGGDSFGYPGKSEIAPLGLSADERADLTAFLGALDGSGPDPKLLSAP
jgi:cytochrome c peroxidase